MFQFPPFALTLSVTGLQPAGLPHSEITGSKPVCSSPVLIAAYHVLLRLQKPRHPPSALVTFSLYDFSHESQELSYKYTCSHLLVALKLQSTTFRLTLYIFSLNCYRLIISSSNFTSLSFLKLVNELLHFPVCLPLYVKKTFHCTRPVPCNSPRSSCQSQTPKRRCSSHTFRYGYLVTT